MKRLFTLLISVVLVGLLRAEAFDISGFDKLLELRTSSNCVASGVVLNDFQALIRLSTNIEGFSYSDFKKENGADLAFLDADKNLLVHEIDTWNPEGESLVWVKIPKLSNGTKIYMVYGNATYKSSISSSDTWTNYTGVWHMKESEGVVADSTGNALDATPMGPRAAFNVGIADGVVGMARKNGGNGSSAAENRAYLSIPNYDSFNHGDTFTISGFFRVTASAGWYRLFSRRGSGGGWGQETWHANAETVYVYGANGPTPTVDIPGLVGNWVYLVFSYNASECKVYANGKLLETLSIDPATDNGLPLSFGCTSAGDDWSLYGDYDEVRLSGGNLSTERIAADYATATDKSFFLYGAVENCNLQFIDPSAYTKFLRITASSTALPVGDVVNNFPALVRLSESIEGFKYSDFMDNGADLVFADASGRLLASEIDTWNPSGESLVWVKIPLFCNDIDIYAYWGANTPSSIASKDTWSGFTGIWHMNESGANSEVDVSGNGLDAKPWSSAKTEEMVSRLDGAVGLARVNQSSPSGVSNCLSVPSYPAIGDTFTVSGWFNASIKDGWHRLLSRKTAYGTDGWEVEMVSGENGVHAYGHGESRVRANVSDLEGSWNHLAFVYCGTAIYVYQNGVEVAHGDITAVTDLENRPLGIGNNSICGERPFVGSYDEVRLGAGALSAERIAADYATVKNAEFFSYGSVSMPTSDAPQMYTPVLSKNELGEMFITIQMASGTCVPYLRLTSAQGNIDIALEESYVSGSNSWTVKVPKSLEQGCTYSYSALGINSRGGEVIEPGSSNFYVGELNVVKTLDAAEDDLVPGKFTVTRNDTYGDLEVNYILNGSAVAGIDYLGHASGSVIIPSGSQSVEVIITPKVNAVVNADTSVDFAFSDGAYLASNSTATMKIFNLRPITRRDFKKCIEFSLPMNFLDNDEVLVDFPVLVRISPEISSFRYSDFELAQGGDMMFTDSTGHSIPSEVAKWDETGTSLVWVIVPKLSRGTRIKMFYGNGANPAGIDLPKWPGFMGVWHMDELSGTAYDSTANSFDALAVRNNRSRQTDLVAAEEGAIGRARVNQAGTTFYDVGSYDDEKIAMARRNYLLVPNNVDHDLDSHFSFSGWFRTKGGSEWKEHLAYKSNEGYTFGWRVSKMPTVDSGEIAVEVVVADGFKSFTIPNMRDAWVHLLVSMDTFAEDSSEDAPKSRAKVYANGEYVGEVSGSAKIRENSYPLTFGNINSTTSGYAYYGEYDELRLKSTSSSPNWAKAEYLTVTDPAFVTPSSAAMSLGGFHIIIR